VMRLANEGMAGQGRLVGVDVPVPTGQCRFVPESKRQRSPVY